MNANDLKTGMVFSQEGEMQVVVSCQHVKPGKGPAYIKCKMRGLDSGKVFERSLRSGEKVEIVRITEDLARFLYRDQDTAHFLDETTMEELSTPLSGIENCLPFLREGDEIRVRRADGRAIGYSLPDFVELKVVSTVPGARGDTVQAARKPATLETGAVVQVPLFVDEGDTLRIDTRTGEYAGRA